ncbi:CAP domain-containing protein [Apilactobacillus apisilvae]|uniref:CAP domain-containing protein n=1 Tax=Apilactobacillus apisilvae TaxID=2923364 RepID=A0ABY4PGW0_9LACO|nr:CAP domain-containing protein [Apilactobacillus apisilvae]UQS84880.1 CAP domain-containing protein [Apilactobacillus apisilvae]
MKKIITALMLLSTFAMVSIISNCDVHASTNPIKINKITNENKNSIATIYADNNENVYTKDFKKVLQPANIYNYQKVLTGKTFHVKINGKYKIYQAIYQHKRFIGCIWHNAINIDKNKTFSFRASTTFRKLINVYRKNKGLAKIKFSHHLTYQANQIAQNVDNNFLPKNNNNQIIYYANNKETYMPSSFSYLAFKDLVYFDQNNGWQNRDMLSSNVQTHMGISAVKSPLHIGNHNDLNNYYLVILVKKDKYF